MRQRTYLCLFVPALSRPMCTGSLFCPWLWPLSQTPKRPLASPAPQHMVPLQLRSDTISSGSPEAASEIGLSFSVANEGNPLLTG